LISFLSKILQAATYLFQRTQIRCHATWSLSLTRRFAKETVEPLQKKGQTSNLCTLRCCCAWSLRQLKLFSSHQDSVQPWAVCYRSHNCLTSSITKSRTHEEEESTQIWHTGWPMWYLHTRSPHKTSPCEHYRPTFTMPPKRILHANRRHYHISLAQQRLAYTTWYKHPRMYIYMPRKLRLEQKSINTFPTVASSECTTKPKANM